MHQPGGQAPTAVSMNASSQGKGGEGCRLTSASAVPTFSGLVKLPRFLLLLESVCVHSPHL